MGTTIKCTSSIPYIKLKAMIRPAYLDPYWAIHDVAAGPAYLGSPLRQGGDT
jgi:hypothetical protein